MTQEEKQLLLKDLCARLPYNVRIRHYVNDIDFYSNPLMTYDIDQLENNKAIIKPYLRPMSSMTDEEKKKVCSLNGISLIELNERLEWSMYIKVYTIETFDLFNALHIDYRNLIPKGLAIAVTEDNNPYKE